ncbi:MAG: flagellar protein FlgN [Candidatus Gastranaerophilales bacterium]|nr:flagellar protein FlgN [Candidatus Gastranaerophilales bacterium]
MNNLSDLENILNKEIETFLSLEKLLKDKKETLIKVDVDSLQTIDDQIKEIAQKIQNIQKERLAISDQSLDDILKEIDDKSRISKFSKIREKIKSLGKSIEKLNNVNQELIEHGLKLINADVTSIIKAFTPVNNTYNKQGQSKNINPTGISSVIKRV